MPKIVQKRWVNLFVAVSILMLTQVVWWLDVFTRSVRTISHLREENALLKGILEQPGVLEGIRDAAYHKYLMFFSETAVFAALTALGLYLLFRALRMQEKAREMQKQFIETMTHESKTPLTALKLRLESTLEKNSKGLQLSKEIEQSLEEVRRLASVFEKALTLNRMENYAFQFEDIQFSEMVKEVVRRMDPLFKQKNVQVELSLAKDLWLRGDLYAIQNIIQSLLENAVLYNDKDDRNVSIDVIDASNKILVKINDNGPGIPIGDRAHVFEKFFRGRTGRKIPGTGLGLYLARYIVNAHSGVIRLVDSPKAGTFFEVELPKMGEPHG